MISWQLLIYNTMNFVSVYVCLVGLMVRVTGWINFSDVDQAVIQIFWKVIGPICELLGESDGSHCSLPWQWLMDMTTGKVLVITGSAKIPDIIAWKYMSHFQTVDKEYNRRRRSNIKQISIFSSLDCWPKTYANQPDKEIRKCKFMPASSS